MLQVIWFILVGMLFTGYAILDGFDLGVGMLHMLGKTDLDRRLMLNSIGPIWDGNEVWLVTAGGALFAAFPGVYASMFSGFYLPLMMLLTFLILRAVSIEFRSKQPQKAWRLAWDIGFSLGSLGAALILGIAVGNLTMGLHLNARHDYTGGLLDLLHPYALLVGITTVALFLMHGSIYLVMKTEGDLRQRIEPWVNRAIIFFIMCVAATTMATLLYIPYVGRHFRAHPWMFVFALANMLAIANIPRAMHLKKEFQAFMSSCFSIVMLMCLLAGGIFPYMMISRPRVNSLTVFNAANTPHALSIMLILAIIGIPLVASYTFAIYWIFRGKTRLDITSY